MIAEPKKTYKAKSDSGSSMAMISTTKLQLVVESLKNQRHCMSTRENYYEIWKNFNQFFLKLDDKSTSWGKRLTLYIGYLIQNKWKSTTIKSYISAIKAILKDSGIKFNLDESLISALTQACRLRNDTFQTKFPIGRELLHLLLKAIHKVFKSPQPYLVTMYKALFVTAYYGLFRIGEISSSPHVIKAMDVHISLNKNKMMFILQTSKTHGLGNKPQIIKINGVAQDKLDKTAKVDNSANQHLLCPFKILQSYVAKQKKYITETEPVLCI